MCVCMCVGVRVRVRVRARVRVRVRARMCVCVCVNLYSTTFCRYVFGKLPETKRTTQILTNNNKKILMKHNSVADSPQQVRRPGPIR